jgi:proteasome activator subunit 4
MKGALWTINYSAFGKYALSGSSRLVHAFARVQTFSTEPTLSLTTVKHLFGCQHNEKPSLQNCVSVVFENCKLTGQPGVPMIYIPQA